MRKMHKQDLKLKICWHPMPLKCWQSPWGIRRIHWRGSEPHQPHGWQLGLGVIGFELWLP